jgi:D-lyxose ketol-isomerase
MKRSEINKCIQEAKEIFAKHSYILPPWAYFSPDDWAQKGAEYDEIRENMLGWDVTDFGLGDYEKTGLLLFTIRNGNCHKPGNRKTYAEKLMLVKNRQVTPSHFHWSKMEDIINRAGGVLCIQVWQSDEKDQLSEENFSIQIDGVTRQVAAGEIIRLPAGESISLEPRVYHQFWAENAAVVVGEVSQVNDDNTDNRFYEPVGRFPAIEEDEAPLHLLCNEYPRTGQPVK